MTLIVIRSRRQRALTVTAAVLVVVGVIAASAVARGTRRVPQGNAGVLQYVESIPTASGGQPTSSVQQHAVGAPTQSGGGSGPGAPGQSSGGSGPGAPGQSSGGSGPGAAMQAGGAQGPGAVAVTATQATPAATGGGATPASRGARPQLPPSTIRVLSGHGASGTHALSLAAATLPLPTNGSRAARGSTQDAQGGGGSAFGSLTAAITGTNGDGMGVLMLALLIISGAAAIAARTRRAAGR